ncbi:hypothetical protein Efla_004196 [Eimeria flavescens]
MALPGSATAVHTLCVLYYKVTCFPTPHRQKRNSGTPQQHVLAAGVGSGLAHKTRLRSRQVKEPDMVWKTLKIAWYCVFGYTLCDKKAKSAKKLRKWPEKTETKGSMKPTEPAPTTPEPVTRSPVKMVGEEP